MRTPARLFLAATVVALALSACGNGNDPTLAPPPGDNGATTTAPGDANGAGGAEVVDTTDGDHQVAIAEFSFTPAALTVSAGDTVVWQNDGAVGHTVTERAGAFDSERVEGGGTFAVRFTEAGSFAYTCTIHPTMGATITVS